MMMRVFVGVVILSLMACRQGEGERCQVDSDCDDGLICSCPSGGEGQACDDGICTAEGGDEGEAESESESESEGESEGESESEAESESESESS